MSSNEKLDKILFWTDLWFFHFGIAKKLQEKIPCDIYSVIDVNDKARKFFEEQSFVKYKKTWYYTDNVSGFNKLPDLDYLKSFEKKYNINLWSIAYTDRAFYKYNELYKFTESEILCILEQECKFFEKVLDEVKPDFLAIYFTITHYQHLLCEICKARGIKVLMMSPTKFGNKLMILENDNRIDDKEIKSGKKIERTEKDILNYLENHSSFSQVKRSKEISFESKKLKRYKSSFDFFMSTRSKNFGSRYSDFGKTRWNVLNQKLRRSIRRKSRKAFVDKNLIKNIDLSSSFIYFPLHYEPERMLLISSPYYDNQLSIITNIAKSLPIGYKLFVKEHPMMGTIGWRDTSYYKQILDLPNVKLIHPDVSPNEILSNCSLVITIGGTTGLEAAFYKKPSIVLTNQIYSILPSVHTLNKIQDLPNAIRNSLQKQVDLNDLAQYIDIIENNSFEIDLTKITTDFAYRFKLKGPHMDANLPKNEIQSFLDQNSDIFEKLADEHIKKIKMYRLQMNHRKNN